MDRFILQPRLAPARSSGATTPCKIKRCRGTGRLTRLSDVTLADSSKRTILCDTHGEAGLGLVCAPPFSQPDDAVAEYFVSHPNVQAGETEAPRVWCSACDEVLMREGEWNDTSEGLARPHNVCVVCQQKTMDGNTPGAD